MQQIIFIFDGIERGGATLLNASYEKVEELYGTPPILESGPTSLVRRSIAPSASTSPPTLTCSAAQAERP
ncbi:MAG: hypothetical protein K2X34_09850 [Hyphomonadaceae bacterium]|nr:hypothetical protein [Hyphomonadaceae bacterium]